ncbi:MAG: rod shape-determining protein [Lachnospiraceae bacterium]|jgi:rod shape-determining protein MreB|nr:rod shape-determining protein [Lachnospiraceae bacterium]
MARNTYGLDLGSYEIKIYDHAADLIWKAKSSIAIANKKEVMAIGDEAYEMFEKVPDEIQVLFPMKEGVISRFDDMQFLLQNLLQVGAQFMRGTNYLIAVPTDVTEVEKKAFFDLFIHSAAKAKEVNIVERSIAEAVGLGLNLARTKGVFIANMGGETTEMSVLAEGGIVLNRLMKMGGAHFDQSVITMVKNSQDFLIGRVTAEHLRRNFDLFSGDTNSTIKVAGRDLISGVPASREIPIATVRAAMKEPLETVVAAMEALMNRSPSEVLKAIRENGICLTGGIANTNGLAEYISELTALPVRSAAYPETCSVQGLRKIMESDELTDYAYSMLDAGFKWMR